MMSEPASMSLSGTRDIGGLGATKDIGGPSSQEVTTTLREGMSLIDRFYNGGNRTKPEALNIIVAVLDQVILRMREQYTRHKAEADELREKCRAIDETLARFRPLQVGAKSSHGRRRRAHGWRTLCGRTEWRRPSCLANGPRRTEPLSP